jgi:hypothetical protein
MSLKEMAEATKVPLNPLAQAEALVRIGMQNAPLWP